MAKTFEITEKHLKLIKRLNFDWNDAMYNGAPIVDAKRPYGNSDIENDIAEIIGIEKIKDAYGEDHLPFGCLDEINQLHSDMAIVLQICCSLMQFECGKFKKNSFFEWEKI